MSKISQSYLISRAVIVVSILIAIILGIAIWDINPWPTDAEAYYMPAAFRLPHVKYLSEIHTTFDMDKVRWLHGKEFYIVGISVFQFLLNDFVSLRPLMVLGLVSIALSAILIFYISRRWWGEKIAVFCYVSFVLCLWPYIYVLFAKHQTLGLAFFLIAVALMLNFVPPDSRKRAQVQWAWPLLSGVSFGLSFFSSTVSALYLPYYLTAFFYMMSRFFGENDLAEKIKMFAGCGLLAGTGFLAVFFYVNLPDIAYNISSFSAYVRISGAFNHFYYNQVHLQQWFPNINVGEVRGGWEWIFKYLMVIMPVLFPLYLLSALYLIRRIFQVPTRLEKLIIIVILGISMAPALMAEVAQVAQYGANYFPMLMGVIGIIGYALSQAQKEFKGTIWAIKLRNILAAALALHIILNVFMFVSDIYACRMVTTFLSQKIQDLKIKRLWSYRANKHRNNFVYCLNPDLRDKLGWLPLKYLAQAEEGYILIPPVTGDSLYIASTSPYHNFDKDIFLIQLIRQGLLKDCAVASFPTLANSRLWRHEEEIFSYRDLILGQNFPEEDLGKVWLLDARKVQAHKASLFPRSSDLPLLKGTTQNIGTLEKFFTFEGQRVIVKEDKVVHHLITQLWKVGNPQDTLIASVYKNEDIQPIWIPAGKSFTSQPLSSAQIKVDAAQGLGIFTFDPPLNLKRGLYYCAIYRTGSLDDAHYYQIDTQHFGVQ